MSKSIVLLFLLIFSFNLNAYESEEELKVVISGKVAKYIEWKNCRHDKFIITVFDYPHANLFAEIYRDKKIHSKSIVIKHIWSIDELGETDILYISKDANINLDTLLSSSRVNGVLTISDIRGFVQKGGIMQIYFVSQKLKLKINTDIALSEGFRIKPTLLRIADVVKGSN